MNGSLVAERVRPVALADRYELEEGRVFLTGVQALVRVLLDQHRADARAGLRTATLVSGYQGSPLAGLDQELERLGTLGEEHDVVLRRAVNEELGATAVWGSQLAGTLPGPRFDGVVGVWFGKAPGVDRASDAIRHGNMVGTDPRGGVLALCGDDPACKSSTIPSASESLLAALRVPILVPGSVQEALDLGRHAIACSRASGLWAALKVVTNVADAAGTAEVGLDRVTPVMPVLEWEGQPYVHRPSANLLPPHSLEMERTLVEVRLELAKRYARVNALNRVLRDPPGARLGIVASGVTAHDTLRALADLGLGESSRVRVLQVGMLFPLDEDAIRSFALGLDEVLVIEEKGPFLERLVRDALYGGTATPLVVGHRDERGAPLVPAYGALEPDAITRVVGARVLAHEDLPAVRERLGRLDEIARRSHVDLGVTRGPFFCSGCPHNSSMVASEEAIVGAGIGCHTMVMLAGRHHGQVVGATQMGAEGAQWIGAAPFVDVPHFVQNLGDGTFHHSGSLAIRAAVAAGINVTYKLLVNGYVAMTGGQRVEGQMSVPALTRSLEAEGVRRIIITTENPSSYTGVALAAIAEVRDRGEILQVQRELARVDGVTVLLHDQACAAELRRERKRGRAAEPARRVLINERVCEGCGDCGEKSSCLSVEPVDTEFGRKTRINQTSCNKDYSCLEGDCPSFLTVHAPKHAAVARAIRPPGVDLPEPETWLGPADVRVRLVGIGGTGVVTVSHVLGVAALLDGRHVSGLDQTGLSQKAGGVISDLYITESPVADSVTPPSASVDVLLAFDLVGAATAPVLRVADRDLTVAIVSDRVTPTAQMVLDVDAPIPDSAAAHVAIDDVTRARDNVYLDATLIAERILGDATCANVVLLGAAWQRGTLPLTGDSLQEALRLNGVAVEANLAAFAWGRAWVAAPEHVQSALSEQPIPALRSALAVQLAERVARENEALRGALEVRIDDLLGWGGVRAATSYAETISRVHAIESERIPGSSVLTEAVARGLHKLIAYKDEYEVARLHIEGLATLPPHAKLTFHLHPPVLRALGMRRKMKLGRWFVPVLRVLRHGRGLRGTPLDPFGHTQVRRVERALPGEYLALVDLALPRLTAATLDLALEIAALPELVRGYEEIKLAGVERFRARAAEVSAQLLAGGGAA
jgi:indolepyruvate ferredoxin oxidoreductase